jgi:hypothetical protein
MEPTTFHEQRWIARTAIELIEVCDRVRDAHRGLEKSWILFV